MGGGLRTKGEGAVKWNNYVCVEIRAGECQLGNGVWPFILDSVVSP